MSVRSARGDHVDRPLALHPHVDHAEAERQAAAVELVREVAPRRAGGAGDHADTQRAAGSGDAPVRVEQPAGNQSAHDVVALQRHLAEREPRVEAAHLQPELSRRREVVEMPEDPHLQSVTEAQPMLGEDGSQAHPRYGPTTVPGVRRLGSTLRELSSAEQFDLIICSHVVEHLAAPGAAVRALGSHLRTSGRLYVEVPMEIWAESLPEEPVTHVNFFTPSSLQLLLEESGLTVDSCRLEGAQYVAGAWALVVCAVARQGATTHGRTDRHGPSETMAFLSPNVWLKLMSFCLMPRAIPMVLRSQLRASADRLLRSGSA